MAGISSTARLGMAAVRHAAKNSRGVAQAVLQTHDEQAYFQLDLVEHSPGRPNTRAAAVPAPLTRRAGGIFSLDAINAAKPRPAKLISHLKVGLEIEDEATLQHAAAVLATKTDSERPALILHTKPAHIDVALRTFDPQFGIVYHRTPRPFISNEGQSYWVKSSRLAEAGIHVGVRASPRFAAPIQEVRIRTEGSRRSTAATLQIAKTALAMRAVLIHGGPLAAKIYPSS